MQEAFKKIKKLSPSIKVDGEMNADLALSESSKGICFSGWYFKR